MKFKIKNRIKSSTYGDLENQTDQIWKFENYAIIYEFDKFHNRFPLPPPLNLLTYIATIFYSLRRRLIKKEILKEYVDHGDKKILGKR